MKTTQKYLNSPDNPTTRPRGRQKGMPMLTEYRVADLLKSCGHEPVLVRAPLTPIQMQQLGIKTVKTSQGAVSRAVQNALTKKSLS